MTTLTPGQSLVLGFWVALGIAGGRGEAVRLLEGSRASAARSFLVLALALPAQVGLLLLGLAEAGIWPAAPLRWFLAHGISLVIGAVAFPLAMLPITRALSREAHWARHVEAWNYAGLVQLGLLAAAALLGPLLGPPYDLVPALGATLFALRIGFLVARGALAVTAGPALLVVATELLLAAFLGGIADTLARG